MPAGSPYRRVRPSEGSRFPSRSEAKRLRLLVANEQRDRLDVLAEVVAILGHELLTSSLQVTDVAEAIARDQPDVAFVGEGAGSEHALNLISEIVHTGSCPVIALVGAQDPAYLHEATRRGIYGYILGEDPVELQGVIDIALHRFADYGGLQRAFDRRAIIERAKGILMARHSLDAEMAFAMLREHSQNTGRKLVDVAQAVVDSHLLLVPSAEKSSTERADA
jgi:AmiR/NasT family two-component response regulator